MMRRLRRVRGLLAGSRQPQQTAGEPSSGLPVTRPPRGADETEPAHLMDYAFCSQTHTGLRRANNEDAVFFDEDSGIGILADGMGGYNAGEIASGMATSVVQTSLQGWLAQNTVVNTREARRAVDASIRDANLAVLQASHTNAEYAGMGTTIVVVVFQDDRLYVGHIGDSRCYRLRQGQLSQITKDHSLLQEQLDAGLITPEQAAFSTHRNLVTRALGIDEGVEVDVNEFPVDAGDLYLLCSDGLSDMVDDGFIAEILQTPGSLSAKAGRLVDAANDRGGRDNITVLLVDAIAGARKRGFMDKLLRT